MTITSKPANEAYRDNYDAIFGTSRTDSELERLYAQADRELEEEGAVSLTTLTDIAAAGGDPIKYA